MTITTMARRAGRAPRLLAFVAALGLAGSSVRAQESHQAGDGQAHENREAETHEHAGEHGEHPNNGLLLFLGGTQETAEDEAFFTIGVEYERRFADRWGGQLVVEHVSDFDAWIVAAPVAFRVVDNLWIVAGPGLETDPRRPGLEEHEGGHEIDPHGAEHSAEPHEEADGPFFLWRFGVGYGIHFNERWGLVPSFSLDLVREHGEWVEAWVLGVSLAYHF